MNKRELPVVIIGGEQVALGPLRRDLIATYQRWNNVAPMNQTTANFRPTPLEQEVAAFDAVTQDPTYTLPSRSSGSTA